MCFRPSPVKRNDTLGKTCETCGMPVEEDTKNCPYCGDPIPTNSSDEFAEIDLNHNTRII